MIRIYYAERDTTLYEKQPEQNAGLDEVLELIKIASGSRAFERGTDLGIQANQYNTRILIDFGSEITSIANSVESGEIPALTNLHPTSASVFLNLRTTKASDLLQSYSIKAYAVSESWDNGRGRVDDAPKTKIAASWYNRSGDAVAQSGVAWATASAHSGNTGKGTTELAGGGTWITGSGFEASQSFNNEAPDLRINVTNIVKLWTAGGITNNGFIIKRPFAEEQDGLVRGSIAFFGRESHTIFVPKLEVCWDDSSINSVSPITSNTYVPYFKNIKAEYRTSEIARFFVGVRPEFPTKSYATSSFYITGDTLPLSSSYEIIDSVTKEVMIKDEKVFGSSKTKISQDTTNGSFFDLRMDSFMPERYYKIKLTCRRTNDTQTFDDFYFKVVN